MTLRKNPESTPLKIPITGTSIFITYCWGQACYFITGKTALLPGGQAAPCLLAGKPDIKDVVAGRTDKKPFGSICFLPEHGVKAVLISARRADLELFFKFNLCDFIVHSAYLPVPSLYGAVEAVCF
jgi:hypothetical protein